MTQSDVAAVFWYGVAAGVAGCVALWVWTRMARLAGLLARRRGYPRLAGIVAGLLTGPLAIATFAILPSRHRVHHDT
ncbi:MAG: hypothetical protein QOG65_1558 [Actinomycetota bacterium]|jgi:hypothetical protein|nr:hypothetical protein [Actinomycetota bacterium]MDQ1384179.1 hypothetical protein [Actinomycetota bacterium]